MFKGFRRAWKSYWCKTRLRKMQWEWLPSQPVSLALSASTGQAGMAVALEPTAAYPRLRLPQKSLSGSRPTRPLYTGEEDRAAADIPTRPAAQSRSANSVGATSPLRVGVGWHPGIARRHSPNEDSVLTLQGVCSYQDQLVPFGLFVVADGMGGHEGGMEASRIATRGMMHTVLQTIMMGSDLSDEYLMDILIGGVEWANMAIYQRGQELGHDMGTTLTAVLVLDMKVYVVNVGATHTSTCTYTYT